MDDEWLREGDSAAIKYWKAEATKWKLISFGSFAAGLSIGGIIGILL